MRRRLALTVLAVTAMVTIAYLVPLAFAVRLMAADRSISAADQESRTLAGVLAAVSDPRGVAAVVDQLNAGNRRSAAVILPSGQRIGAGLVAPAAEVDLARTGRAFTASSLGQTRVWVPVRLANGGVTIGVVSIPSSSRYTGVLQAWAVLAAVGALVLVLSVILVDRMARSMVVAIEELGTVTRRLQQGDLAARVRPAGPTEVSLAGRAVNELAERIGQLLATERESAADLSHRLRTPLTALHLAADGLRCTEDVSADRAAA